jgi:hypothetical protein
MAAALSGLCSSRNPCNKIIHNVSKIRNLKHLCRYENGKSANTDLLTVQ